MSRIVKVLTDNVTEQRILEAILRHRPYWDSLKMDSGLGGTSILSIGSSSLLRNPEQPVAMVLNADTEKPAEIKKLHNGIKGYMSFSAPEYWHLALAIPKVDAWALADGRFRRAFEETPHSEYDRYNRAIAMKELTEHEPFDVEALRRSNAEFRRLDDFLVASTRTLAGAKAPAVRS
jgi:hypothetical protein